MEIKPLANRLLVQDVAAETKTAGGIIIPEAAQEKTTMAIVKRVGPDVTTVKAGDKIIYTKYAGVKIKNDGEDYLILKVDDVIAICD